MKMYDDLSVQDKKDIRKSVSNNITWYRIFTTMDDLDDDKKEFLEKVKRAVNSLPELERELIEKRYMDINSDYVTDFEVYTELLNEPICPVTYSVIRDRAIIKLAILLDIDNGLEIEIRKKPNM